MSRTSFWVLVLLKREITLFCDDSSVRNVLDAVWRLWLFLSGPHGGAILIGGGGRFRIQQRLKPEIKGSDGGGDAGNQVMGGGGG